MLFEVYCTETCKFYPVYDVINAGINPMFLIYDKQTGKWDYKNANYFHFCPMEDKQ